MDLFEEIGFAFRDQKEPDFGIDAHAELIEDEKPTRRLLAVQLKSGSSYFAETTEDAFVFRIDAEHIDYWLNGSLPVLICLCDMAERVIYWQHVNSETAISTGKGFRIHVPKRQQLVPEAVSELRDILTPIVPIDRYSLLSTRDQSHGTAKRYEFRAILNPTLSKAEIASVVRQLTYDGAKCRYHRNHLVEARWGDSDAHVVSTFVYPTFEDFDRDNYFCRSQWISDDLAQESRPNVIRGENIGDGIIVDWNQGYRNSAGFLKSLEVTKEDYLARALPLAEELISLSEIVATELGNLSRNETSESTFLLRTKKKLVRIGEIDSEIAYFPLGPVECGDVRKKLLELIGYADNIAVFNSDTGIGNWDERSRLSQSMDRVPQLRKIIGEFKYELDKIR